jgi:hypothetical protein
MDILNQRFVYAGITLVKDYCKIDTTIEEFEPEITEIFDRLPSFNVSPMFNHDSKFKYVNLMPKKEKGPKTRYYYVEEDCSVNLELALKNKSEFGRHDGRFETTKDKHIKKHYANPFAAISVTIIERTIKIVGDKVYVKSYRHNKSRDVNCIYFKKSTHVDSITFDLVKGDITIGDITLTSKIKKRRYRKNTFSNIERILSLNNFTTFTNLINSNSPIYNEFKSNMNDDEFFKVMFEQIGEPLPDDYIFQTNPENKDMLLRKVLSFFVKRKKIKVPNDYFSLLTTYYPGEKFLKKNDRKLIQSILDSFGVKSKSTVRLLHENINLDIELFKSFCKFFGDKQFKYISALTPKSMLFFNRITSGFITTTPINMRINKNLENEVVDDETKENIIKIVNSIDHKMTNICGIFNDHFSMIKRINEYDPSVKMRAKTYTDFQTEHNEFSKLISIINKGWSTEYIFDNRMVRNVESVIRNEFGGTEYNFNPVILKRDEEYSEEGSFMHHCVASYSNKVESIIVSLRTNQGLDRVTCEFNKKTGECLQERYFCNKVPPDYFINSLKTLKERVKKSASNRLLDHIDLKKVRVKINGIEVSIPVTQTTQQQIPEIFLDF